MRTQTVIGITALLLCTVAPSFATTSVGVVACGHGIHPLAVTCPPGGCVADAFMLTGALTCLAGQTFEHATVKVSYIQGVCGDQPAALPGLPALGGSCGTMFTMRTEACVSDSATDANMPSVRSWGRWRLCYDSSGTGDCSGASPAGIVILAGSSTIASEQGHNAGGAAMVLAELRRTQSASFVFPPITGSSRNISMKIGVAHFSTEPVLSPCAGPDCGVSGCMVKLK